MVRLANPSIKKCNCRFGHTLVELMVALPLTIAILVAAGGLIVAVSKSQVFASGLMADRAASFEAAQHILSDLQFASSLAEYSLHSVEFSTQDRNDDGVEDSIKYVWSGIEGDPLQYSINGADFETLADNVHQFELEYGRVYDHTETLLHHHSDAMDGQFLTCVIDDNHSASQYFLPRVHAFSTKWTLNRIRIRARSVGVADGKINVSIVKPIDQLPSNRVFEIAQFDESELDSEFSWFDIYFAKVSNLPVGTSVCVVVSALAAGSDAAAEICFETAGATMPADTHWAVSTNGEMSWSTPDDVSDMQFFAIGTHDSIRASRSVVQKVQLSLQIGGNANAKALSSVRLINEPETDPVILIAAEDDPVDTGPIGSETEAGGTEADANIDLEQAPTTSEEGGGASTGSLDSKVTQFETRAGGLVGDLK